jgi:hypothetical protein
LHVLDYSTTNYLLLVLYSNWIIPSELVEDGWHATVSYDTIPLVRIPPATAAAVAVGPSSPNNYEYVYPACRPACNIPKTRHFLP